MDEYVEEVQDSAEDALGTDAPDASARAIERATDEELNQATIAVEEIEGPVVLVSGGADQVWASTAFANHIVERLADHDHPWDVEHLAYPEAGHAIRVPYRFGPNDAPDSQHRFGGTNATNAYASADAWQGALRYLQRGLRD